MKRLWCLGAVLVCACGSSKPPAAQPQDDVAAEGPKSDSPPSKDAPPPEETAAAETGMPKSCAKQMGEVCLPSAKFAKGMCDKDLPTVALAMFAKDTPWTRGYLTRETKAWNASGGGSSEEKLAFDEEVIVLRKREAKTGGITVSGSGDSYDVVRMDGACVTLDQSELTFQKPPKPKHPRLIWKRLDESMREALRKDETVLNAVAALKKECKGVTMGDVSLACVKADTKLTDVIADFVRRAEGLPSPDELP